MHVLKAAVCYCHLCDTAQSRHRRFFFPFRRALSYKDQFSLKTQTHCWVEEARVCGEVGQKRHMGAVLTLLPPPPKTTRLQC